MPKIRLVGIKKKHFCKGCGFDLRNTGIGYTEAGIRLMDMTLSATGEIEFKDNDFETSYKKPPTIYCKGCGKDLMEYDEAKARRLLRLIEEQ